MSTTPDATAATSPGATGRRVLAVVTSADEYEKAGYRTGLWLGELTHFYDVLVEAGHRVDVASIAGGRVPLDPESLGTLVLKQGGTGKRYEDRGFMALLDDTVAVADVDPDTYDAVYLTGGHGTMFDFDDPALKALVARTWDAGKVVSAVCHGPCGLLDVPLADGTPLLAGRKVTGFSWAEEKVAGRADAVPFSLEERLGEQAGEYTKALLPMAPHVVVDGRLVTGQNPTSAARVGKAVLELLDRPA